MVRVGAVLHDIGKIQHPQELSEPGHEHDATGQQMLIARDVSESIADMCITHAQWQAAESLEALIVALADKLWKGKRIRELEDRIIRQIADSQQQDFWFLYTTLDECFEWIAGDAPRRLAETLPYE